VFVPLSEQRGWGEDGNTACGERAKPVEMEWDGGRNNGDGRGWGQILVLLQISNMYIGDRGIYGYGYGCQISCLRQTWDSVTFEKRILTGT